MKSKPTSAMVAGYNRAVTGYVSAVEYVPDDLKGELHEMLWSAIMRHEDTSKFNQELVERFGIRDYEASAIGQYQHALARMVLENEGRLRSGLKEATWMHGGVLCKPLRHHKSLDGRRYKITDGVLVAGVARWPGIDRDCQCWSKPFLPGFDDEA